MTHFGWVKSNFSIKDIFAIPPVMVLKWVASIGTNPNFKNHFYSTGLTPMETTKCAEWGSSKWKSYSVPHPLSHSEHRHRHKKSHTIWQTWKARYHLSLPAFLPQSWKLFQTGLVASCTYNSIWRLLLMQPTDAKWDIGRFSASYTRTGVVWGSNPGKWEKNNWS